VQGSPAALRKSRLISSNRCQGSAHPRVLRSVVLNKASLLLALGLAVALALRSQSVPSPVDATVQLRQLVDEVGSDPTNFLCGRKLKKWGPHARFGSFPAAAVGVLSLAARSLSAECAATR
jgi:hypothetical protein